MSLIGTVQTSSCRSRTLSALSIVQRDQSEAKLLHLFVLFFRSVHTTSQLRCVALPHCTVHTNAMILHCGVAWKLNSFRLGVQWCCSDLRLVIRNRYIGTATQMQWGMDGLFLSSFPVMNAGLLQMQEVKRHSYLLKKIIKFAKCQSETCFSLIN